MPPDAVPKYHLLRLLVNRLLPLTRGAGGKVLSLSPVPHKLVRVLRFRDLVYIDRAGKCALGNYRTTTFMMNQ